LESAISPVITMVSENEKIANQYVDSSKMIFVALNPILGFRKDAHCYKYRNFLVEIDIGTTKEQLEHIKTMGIPYSAAIFSGGKSVHFLISLDKDLPNEESWRKIAEWIIAVITLADRNCKNPSRSIRLPGVMRDTGKMQELLQFKGQVKFSELREWLMRWPNLMPKPAEKIQVYEGDAFWSKLKPWTKKKLLSGVDKTQGRNKQWFSIGCDFALAGFSEYDTLNILQEFFIPDRDFGAKEWRSAVKSGLRHIHNRK
jgi:hypothetical protein